KETEPGPSEESEKKPLKSRPEQDEQDNIIEVKSPIVGIFYRAPSPDAPPFVKVGDKVKKGDVLCIIEAMKLMNKITSDYDGEIKEILVQNEEPVEFNQTLMTIKIEE
ncbi:MAG: acetyl-CoA carboxylase biotin carboxyl carrier protein, partial [Actinobacteria bacterium]|nr:acetyl-CoA carboxylase biotin carboxyl carrier protein [Actinomycetota bacterium]